MSHPERPLLLAGDINNCPGRRGRLIALSVFLCKSVLYGAFVWVRRALEHQKLRFPARAVIFFEDNLANVKGRRASRRPFFADKWVISGGVKGSTVWPVDGEARIRRRYGKVNLCRAGGARHDGGHTGSCRRFVVYSLVDHRPPARETETGVTARPDLAPRLYQIFGEASGVALDVKAILIPHCIIITDSL